MAKPNSSNFHWSDETPKVLDGGQKDAATDSTRSFSPQGVQRESLPADPTSERLVVILDDYFRQLQSGKAPDRESLLAAHPNLADRLAECLAGLEFIHTAHHSQGANPPATIGDFRIIREVGQGGMGAVYEAEQVSLRRRVALKILRFGGLSDPDAIERFQREAETVARLHHTHIVPIFAVGREQGIHFYAMQFIDGKSLDQVLRERCKQGQQLPYETVANWGLQAAEALAHAHARGVIHRDVKPSNLMIDAEENRVWLTDFGLAKKLDDVTLSMTGALLGTPRYMSPEQATATQHPIDHRTDIYSLGASLYELLTGRALFTGDSPHQVISQILTTEPESPRKHRPSLPRDLETILLKCLSKEAAQRYTSAEQLVSDLRAFLEGRSIAARRANMIERTNRWVKRQRRSVALTAITVVATLAVVLSGLAGGYAWKRSQLAFVMLKTDHPPLVSEWIDNGEHVIPPATVPTQNRLEVPAGNYEFRLSGHDRLSQTYTVELKPGESFDHKVDLDDQLLWGDRKIERSYQMVRFEQRANTSNEENERLLQTLSKSNNLSANSRCDVVLLTGDGLQCLNGQTGEARWNLNLRNGENKTLNKTIRLVWPWDRFVTSTYGNGLEIFDDRPMLISQADVAAELFMDFNRDGNTDLVLASRNQACVLAIDGQSGEPIWIEARGESMDTSSQVHSRLGAVLYPPMLVKDQDSDAVDDLLLTFITISNERAVPKRFVELVSGATGKSIWEHHLLTEDFALPAGEPIPYQLQWFHGQGGGYSNGGGGFTVSDQYYLRHHPFLERSGPHHYLPTQPSLNHLATFLDTEYLGTEGKAETSQPKSVVTLTAGRRIVQLDLRDGSQIVDHLGEERSTELEIRPAIQPISADFDGDGKADLLVLEPVLGAKNPTPNQATSQVDLAAWSMTKRVWLWKHRVTSSMPRQPEMDVPAPAWPLAVDIDSDGAAEVLIPSDHSESSQYRGGPPWGQLTLLDGRTGKTRWRRKLYSMDQRLDHFIAGPDINNDGYQEIYVATAWCMADAPSEESLFVDCLSGIDGNSLWRTQQPLTFGDIESKTAGLWLTSLRWHPVGADGWPQLIVPMRRSDASTTDRTYFFSAGTGKTTHVAMGVTEMDSGDLDADGILDLLLFSRKTTRSLSEGGTLTAVRGNGDQAWRKIADTSFVAVGDLDRDGVRDVVTEQSRTSFEAFSGATGKKLWHMQFRRQAPTALKAMGAQQLSGDRSLDSEDQDLNGDGVTDLILVSQRGNTQLRRPLLTALSGRDGKAIWDSEAVGQVITLVQCLACRDLDGDGSLEVVVAAVFDHGEPKRQSFGSDDANLWLMILSGETGATQWIEPLTSKPSPNLRTKLRYEDVSLKAVFADLNDDETLDVVLPSQALSKDLSLEMRAISGKDGRAIWRSPLQTDAEKSEALSNTFPAVIGDIDENGSPDVLVSSIVELRANDGRIDNHLHLRLLDGTTGETRWTWKTQADRWRNKRIRQRKIPGDHMHAVIVHRRSGKHWVAVRHWNKQQELHVLDQHGQLVSESKTAVSFDDQQNRFWTIDVNRDGDEELLMIGNSRLMLVNPDQLETPLWQLASDNEPPLQILGVTEDIQLADSSLGLEITSRSQVVLLQSGNGIQTVRGIDAANGRVLWTCVSPSSFQSTVNSRVVEILNPPAETVPPHILFPSPSQTLVRCGVPLYLPQQSSPTHKSDSSNQASVVPWKSYTRRQSELPTLSRDRRLLRNLPWKPAEHEIERTREFIAWSAFYGLTLAFVPVAWMIWVLRDRQWTLQSMLVWAPAASIVMMGVMIDGPDSNFQTLPSKIAIAYFAAGPVIATCVVLGRRLWKGNWRKLVLWLGFAALASLTVVAISLGGTFWRDFGDMQPGEQYRWSGWYWILLPIFYFATWAFMLGLLIKSLGSMFWRSSRFRNRG